MYGSSACRKDKTLKAHLTKANLSTKGDRKALEARHREYTLQMNCLLDTGSRVDSAKVAAEVERAERQRALAESSTASLMQQHNLQRNPTKRSDSFAELVREVRLFSHNSIPPHASAYAWHVGGPHRQNPSSHVVCLTCRCKAARHNPQRQLPWNSEHPLQVAAQTRTRWQMKQSRPWLWMPPTRRLVRWPPLVRTQWVREPPRGVVTAADSHAVPTIAKPTIRPLLLRRLSLKAQTTWTTTTSLTSWFP